MHNQSNKKDNNGKKFSLDELQSKSKFKAPDNYFEQLNAQLEGLIDKEEQEEVGAITKVVPMWQSWKLLAGGLAAACVLIALWVFPLPKNSPTVGQLLSEVSADEIVTYLVYSDLNTEDIINELAVNDISMDEELPSFKLSDDEAEALLDYYSL